LLNLLRVVLSLSRIKLNILHLLYSIVEYNH
jgi:hypothetical protein